ncbi:MAG: DUF4124 domain-containing protein [Halioglobus sp.]
MFRLPLLAVLFSLLACFSGSTTAQIYRTTDEQGNVVFTDKPAASSSSTERVEIQPTNTTPAIQSRPDPVSEPASDADEENTGDLALSVKIVAPADETSLPMGPGNFSVSAQVKPALEADAVLQLYIDGIPWGKPQQGSSWALTNIFRGEHNLTVAVIDTEGKPLATSPPIRVFVHRPSLNFRAR